MTHTSESHDAGAALKAPAPVEAEGPVNAKAKPRAWYRHWWVALAGLVVVAGLVGGSVAIANAQALSRDREAYQEAVDQARKAFAELDAAVLQAQDLAVDCAVKTGQDAACGDLADALTDLPAAPQFADGKDLDRGELVAGRTEADTAGQKARERVELLNERNQAVEDAINAFELDGAKTALADIIGQATTVRDQAVGLIADTQGKVVDDAKRVELQHVVDELSGLIDTAKQLDGDQAQEYKDMTAKLGQLVEGLNDAVAQVQATHQAFLAQGSPAAAGNDGQAASGGRQTATGSTGATGGTQHGNTGNSGAAGSTRAPAHTNTPARPATPSRPAAPAQPATPARPAAPAKPAPQPAPSGGGHWVITNEQDLCGTCDSDTGQCTEITVCG